MTTTTRSNKTVSATGRNLTFDFVLLPFTFRTDRSVSSSFMQNKPNSPSAKMNLTTALTKDYQNIHPHSPLQYKPNFTPTPNSTQPTIKMQNKPNFQTPKTNLTSYGDTDYEQDPPIPGAAKQTQSQTHSGLTEFSSFDIQASLRYKFRQFQPKTLVVATKRHWQCNMCCHGSGQH